MQFAENLLPVGTHLPSLDLFGFESRLGAATLFNHIVLLSGETVLVEGVVPIECLEPEFGDLPDLVLSEDVDAVRRSK